MSQEKYFYIVKGKTNVYIPTAFHLSKCSNKIVTNIAGFVVQSLSKSLACEASVDALTLPNASDNSAHSLVNLKSKGKLIYPTNDAIDVYVSLVKHILEKIYCALLKINHNRERRSFIG